MKLNEVMTKDVKCISPDTSLTEAAKLMDEMNVGDLLICDNDRMAGIITDRDIVIRSVSAGLDPNDTKVRDSMTSPVIFCFDDQELEEAATLMQKHQIRRLPIVSRAKRLVGFVSLGDVAVESGDKHLSGKVLEKVSEPTKSAA